MDLNRRARTTDCVPSGVGSILILSWLILNRIGHDLSQLLASLVGDATGFGSFSSYLADPCDMLFQRAVGQGAHKAFVGAIHDGPGSQRQSQIQAIVDCPVCPDSQFQGSLDEITAWRDSQRQFDRIV